MKAINGIDLVQEVIKAHEQVLEEKRNKLRYKIACIIGEGNKAEGTVTKLRADLLKAEASVLRHKQALDALEKGDWDKLKEDSEQDSKPSSEPAE